MLVSNYSNWKPDSSLLEAALYYASIGMSVYPCHSIRISHGSCGRDNCNNIGKHPRIKSGFLNATTNARQVRHWWRKWHHANIGWRLPMRLCPIDVDECIRLNCAEG